MWKESTRSKLLGTSLFGISPEENTIPVAFAKAVFSFRSTPKHLGKFRLHMVFTLFVNSLKEFFEQTKI